MRLRPLCAVGLVFGFVWVAGCERASEKSAAHPWGMPANAPSPASEPTNEAYKHQPENRVLSVKQHPLSTFSIDVDTASYSNVRRFLRMGQLPPADCVRVEELINYFRYDDPQPDGNDPFSVNVEVAGCPWNAAHRLVRIGLKGKTIDRDDRGAANLVFLIDVSGSMDHPKKLPLVKASMKMLLEQLNESDHIGIAVYAGAAGLVLPPTSAANKERIIAAIDRLQPSGSTNGASGIRLGYNVARQNFVPGGINRVILCTDGDFNVGTTGPGELQQLVESEAKSGVYLTVLGYGMGNLKDSTMEMLADRGNGNYGYVDNIAEAKKLLVEQMSGTLITIAKDVKIQVEFNPAQVAGYRLIGYENRALANRDFRDDTKDAGDVGAGHSVTALYEVVPTGAPLVTDTTTEPLRYQQTSAAQADPIETNPRVAVSDELLMVKLRYKEPDGQQSQLLEYPVVDRGVPFEGASSNLRFAAAVAEFGMLLTKSKYCGEATFDDVISKATESGSIDSDGHRAEFLELVRLARDLTVEKQLVSKRGW